MGKESSGRGEKAHGIPQGGVLREKFLPVSPEDLRERGISQLDFVYVSGDAYVDHPSFGPAIITRLLQDHGYTVGIIAQPDWKNPDSFSYLGRPRLAFLVSAGNMDSMVNHYTVSKKRRQTDAYSPGGKTGRRPDRAAQVYSSLIRSQFRDVPIILGGIEASLRRLAHYDYWSDSLKKSLLCDSGADLISYGMGEHSILEIAEALNAGLPISEITYVPGTCFRTRDLSSVYDAVLLPSYEELCRDRENYAKSFRIQFQNTDPCSGKRLIESYGSFYVVQNPPAMPLSTLEMDDVYSLPYARTYHPDYEDAGGIPALEEVRFSIVSNRGCFGGCSFCALTFHQGRRIQTRSDDSILQEEVLISKDPLFRGYIHDVGGPTANFHQPACKKQLKSGVCPKRECLFPEPCKNLEISEKSYADLLRKMREVPGVKKVFVRSGVRFDYLLLDPSDDFLKELVGHHISGQLKVAPEHVSDRVLRLMGKPPHQVYLKFAERYLRMNRALGKKQYLVPYLISSHPGSQMEDAVELALYLKSIHHQPEQVQDFYPTPSTVSTVMYYTGIHPLTGEKVYVPRDPHEKAMQRALLQFQDPKNHDLVLEALKSCGREDLIGDGPGCLIRKGREKHGKAGKTDDTSDAGAGSRQRPGKRARR